MTCVASALPCGGHALTCVTSASPLCWPQPLSVGAESGCWLWPLSGVEAACCPQRLSAGVAAGRSPQPLVAGITWVVSVSEVGTGSLGVGATVGGSVQLVSDQDCASGSGVAAGEVLDELGASLRVQPVCWAGSASASACSWVMGWASSGTGRWVQWFAASGIGVGAIHVDFAFSAGVSPAVAEPVDPLEPSPPAESSDTTESSGTTDTRGAAGPSALALKAEAVLGPDSAVAGQKLAVPDADALDAEGVAPDAGLEDVPPEAAGVPPDTAAVPSDALRSVEAGPWDALPEVSDAASSSAGAESAAGSSLSVRLVHCVPFHQRMVLGCPVGSGYQPAGGLLMRSP